MHPFNFLLFDSARAEGNLYKAIELNKNYRSLYKGSSEEYLEAVAPYLFAMNENTADFSDWYFLEGWNKSWGLLVFANVGFEELNKHFRKFITVSTEDKEELYFRFYDPRVLRIFLPTCDEHQLKEFFGPVSAYMMEDEDGNFVLKFTLFNGQLQTKRITKEELFDSIKADAEKKSKITSEKAEPTIEEEKKPEKFKPGFGWSFIVD